MTIMVILTAAILIEGIIQVLKGFIPEEKSGAIPKWLWPVCSAILGITLCMMGSIDIVLLGGITLSVPIAGQIVTGLIISRGASFVHDIWKKIRPEEQTENQN